jgi:hypothetical protein
MRPDQPVLPFTEPASAVRHRRAASGKLPGILLLAGLLGCISTELLAQSIRPGLWEVSNRVSGHAQMDAAMRELQEQMAAMPEAQRQMMKEMLASQGMTLPDEQGAAGMSMQVCITPEMAARRELPQQMEGDCSGSAEESDGQTMLVRFECLNPPSSGEGSYRFDGDSAYSMQMTVQVEQDGRQETLQLHGEGRWLSSECPSNPPARFR